MFSYIYDGKSHTSLDLEYMSGLGMSGEAIDSVFNSLEYERTRRENASFAERYAATYAIIEVEIESGQLCAFDIGKGRDGVYGIQNINDALMSLMLGDDPTAIFNWMMADNSEHPVTLNDLKAVAVEFNLRKNKIHTAHRDWRATDKDVSFKEYLESV